MRTMDRGESGFSLIEVLIVVALLGVMAMLAAPSMSRMRTNQRLKDRALEFAAVVNYARSQAVLTGNNHLVFYGTDALGATLQDSSSNPVPNVEVALVNSGPMVSPATNMILGSEATL